MSVAVCGTSVPDVWVVVDVVPAAALVDVLDGAAVVDVVEDEPEVELLEQAANARAQAGRINSLIERFRRAVGMVHSTTTPCRNGGSARCVVRVECSVPGSGALCPDQRRAGAEPITEARSMERRWGQ